MFKLQQFNRWFHSAYHLGVVAILSLLTLTNTTALAQQADDCTSQRCTYVLSEAAAQPLNEHLLVLDSVPLRWQVEDIHRAFQRGDFEPAHGRATARNPQMATWVRLEIAPTAFASQDWMLVSHSVSQRDLQLFSLESDNHWSQYQSGVLQPFALGRDFPYRHPNFHLNLSHDHPLILYLRYEDPVGSIFPLTIKTRSQLEQLHYQELWWFGIIFGVVAGLLLYNLLLMIQLRETTYGWYVLSTAAVLLLIFDGTNLGLQFLTPETGQPRWMDRTSTGALWGALVILFMQRLLNTKLFLGGLHRVLSVLAAVFFIVGVVHQFGFDHFTAQITKPLALIGILLLITAALITLKRGNRTALYFLLGHGVLLGAALLMIARNLGWITPQSISTYIFPAAVAFECIVFSLALAHRIQALQNQHREAVKDAQRDPLTHVLNRRGLDRYFQQIINKGEGQIALILLDLNKFKDVNDTHGHDVGDVLLQTVAERIRHATRGQDAVARLGGDEYAILLHHPQVEQAIARVKQRLKKSFSEPVVHQQIKLQIDASMGIAYGEAQNADYNALYREADQALYRQKRKLNGNPLTTNEAPA